MSIETLLPGGPVHWGVMLAQGWKSELAKVDRAETWTVAQDWARRAELLGFHGVWVFDHFQTYPARDDSPVLGGVASSSLASSTHCPRSDGVSGLARGGPGACTAAKYRSRGADLRGRAGAGGLLPGAGGRRA